MTTWTDLFAGAGGSSTGIVTTGGAVRYAANHWGLAVDVHNANHPATDHICADLSQYDPRRIARTDCLWASPECTNHSRAKGRKRTATGQPDLFGEVLPDAAAERSRATMWDVVRFSEAHRYAAVIVENVVEAVDWEPFQAWLMAMHSIGYEHRIVSMNSMHAQQGGLPAPQSRDRIYVVFWRRGNRAPQLERMQRPRAWCPRCELAVDARQAWKPGRVVGRYRQQYVYVCPEDGATIEPGWLPAAAAIDWSLPGQRIGDRAKPLADKTRARIAAGIARYWHPIHLEAAGHTYDAADPAHKAHGDPNGYYRAWSTLDVLKTLHTIESKAIVTPVGGTWTDRSTNVGTEPLPTQTTNDGAALITPAGGSWNDQALPASHALRALTTRDAYALVAPYYGGSAEARTTDDPIGTLTTVDRYALIQRHNSGGPEMLTPASEVLRTLTTAGHQSVLTPGDIEAARAQVDDCLFRMLEPHEVAAGMAFPADYQWSGTRRERVRMAGNAVTPPAARDLVAAVEESLR